jgi:hypothetical protein
MRAIVICALAATLVASSAGPSVCAEQQTPAAQVDIIATASVINDPVAQRDRSDGKSRDPLAAEVLLDNIAYPARRKLLPRENKSLITGIPRLIELSQMGWYRRARDGALVPTVTSRGLPAVRALVEHGRDCVPAVMSRLINADSNDTLVINSCLDALVDIQGKEETAAMIRDAQARSIPSDQDTSLSVALDMLPHISMSIAPSVAASTASQP